MRIIKIVILLVFIVCSVIFFIQNMATLSKPLALRFDPLPTFAKVEPAAGHSPVAVLDEAPQTESMPMPGAFSWQSDGVPLYVVFLLSFLAGVVFSCAYFLFENVLHGVERIRHKRERRKLQSEVDILKKELEKLKKSPKVTLEKPAPAKAVEAAQVKEIPQKTEDGQESK